MTNGANAATSWTGDGRMMSAIEVQSIVIIFLSVIIMNRLGSWCIHFVMIEIGWRDYYATVRVVVFGQLRQTAGKSFHRAGSWPETNDRQFCGEFV